VTLDFLGTLQRTHLCGDPRSSNSGETITLMGWVNRRRDHGNLIFLDLRDRSGITQVVLDKETSPLAHAKAEAARPEYVVAVTGKLRQRGPGLSNPAMRTGEVELVAHDLLLLNDAKTPPFPIAAETTGTPAPITNEEIRLKFRYLDLRRPDLQKNFVLRHQVTRAIRDYLSDHNFLEVETPLLTASTPEGARDYLVPSRVHPGHFFALPQSPQIFKQLLMVSGFDRYFQIARCFRDEDLRADRQPDFTQIDLEISFPQMSTIFATAEGFLRAAFNVAGISLAAGPFLQMTYDQAIQRYGIDKPDMRLPRLVDLSDLFHEELRAQLKIEKLLPVVGFTIPNIGTLSGTARKVLQAEMRTYLADLGMDVLDVYRLGSSSDGQTPPFLSLSQQILQAMTEELELFYGEPDRQDSVDLHVIVTPKLGNPLAHELFLRRLDNKKDEPVTHQIYKRVGALRLDLGKKLADKHKLFEPTNTAADFKFLWVTDFPMYEWNEEHKTWDAAHHPFTSPHEDDILAGRLTSDKGAVRALAYDIVLNGTELGSGSIRIHRKDVQAEIFRSLGMSDEEAHARFGFFLDALEYGTPPHGGIALGLDRIVMILAGATSLREVIAFPKTAKAMDLMVNAPTTVSDTQLRDLSLKITARS
jgi:aspartyl-tRNA synthetase